MILHLLEDLTLIINAIVLLLLFVETSNKYKKRRVNKVREVWMKDQSTLRMKQQMCGLQK